MTIDSHVHVWDLSRGGYDWPDASVPALHRNMSVTDLAPTLDHLGVDGVVLVQAADTAVDTENMLAEASDPRVRGIVAWADLGADPAAFAADLDRLRAEPLVVGLRNLTHVKDDPHWIRGAHQRENVRQFAATGLPLDMVTGDHHGLDEVLFTLEHAPELRVVLDHLGKPPIGGTAEARREWRDRVSDIAGDGRSVAKLSGLSSSVGPLDAWEPAQVIPFIEDALEIFGPARLMYGGDWPVVLLAGGYERAWDVIAHVLDGADPADRVAVYDGTARRVYGL